jgi:hypothetical protein
VDLGDPMAVRCRFCLGEQAAALAVGGEDDFDHRSIASGGELGDLAHARVLAESDLAAVGLRLAGDQAEQRRFARPVAADNADMAPLPDLGRRFIEQDTSADAVGKPVYGKHGRLDSMPMG